MKKMLTLILALILVLGTLPATVSAAEVLDSGSAGEDIIWTMYDDGRLVFSGTGKTVDNDHYTVLAWSRYMGDIKHVIFEEGITYIGEYLFYNSRSAIYDSVEVLTLPSSLEKIGENAFTSLDGLTTVCITDLEAWCAVDFEGCTNPLDNEVALAVNGVIVENLVIPENVKVLTDYAFKGCSSIRNVVVHENVSHVGSFAFNTCDNLETIYFEGDAPTFGEHVFTLSELTAYYPANNASWSDIAGKDLGGTVTWKSYEPLDFTDVPLGSFYYDPVLWAVKENITSGTTATTFNPNGECLRAQVVTFLWRAAGCPMPTDAENPFVDVTEGDYYYNAVLWAVEKGITAGVDATHFAPMQSCSRAQVVAFLYRAMGSPKVSAESSPFTDVVAGQWYELPVLWAVENGITAGLSADTFGVNTVCNRAQVVTFLYRTYVN